MPHAVLATYLDRYIIVGKDRYGCAAKRACQASVERKIAGILVAIEDGAGNRSLVERLGAPEDEAGTLASLKSLRSELIDPQIAEHQGRMVKLMGDGALAEFATRGVSYVRTWGQIGRDPFEIGHRGRNART